MGRALIGAHVGEEVVVATPRGPVSYRIVAVS
jgi:transcription elongation GreA/GreB family factor